MSETTFSGLAQHIAELLDSCLSDLGFEVPLIVVTVAMNGSCIIARYTTPMGATDDRLEAHFLAEHVEGYGFQLPINIMVSDQRGNAVRAVIESGKLKIVH
jgi:hypothetical protein